MKQLEGEDVTIRPSSRSLYKIRKMLRSLSLCSEGPGKESFDRNNEYFLHHYLQHTEDLE